MKKFPIPWFKISNCFLILIYKEPADFPHYRTPKRISETLWGRVASLFNYCLSILHRSAWRLYFKLVSFEVLDSRPKWLPNCNPIGPHSGLNCAKLKSSTECSKCPCHVRGWKATTKYPAVISVVASSTANCKMNWTFFYNSNRFTACDVVSKAVGEASSIIISF